MGELAGPLFGDGILAMNSATPSYKPRRKMISHALFASKLRAMSDTIFEVIHERLLEWPLLYPNGEMDLVNELINMMGEIVISNVIGAEYKNLKLPYYDQKTDKFK